MAININPRDAFAYNNRGTAYRAKGENDPANADFTKRPRSTALAKARQPSRDRRA
jgi:hypothetical protein